MLQHVRALVGTVPEPVLMRVETAVEELLTNSVVHGGGRNDPVAQVWVGVSAHGGAVNLCYEDALAPFDPAGKIGEALRRTVNPLDQRPLGGLGLLLVYRLADEFRYTRENGRNRLELAFHVRPVLT